MSGLTFERDREKPEMKRASSLKMRWAYVVIPCTNQCSLRTESQKDIDEILKSKLATIIEEPIDMTCDHEDDYPLSKMKKKKTTAATATPTAVMKAYKPQNMKKFKELQSRFKRSRLLLSAAHFSTIKESYIHFLAGFVAKGSLTGSPSLPRN